MNPRDRYMLALQLHKDGHSTKAIAQMPEFKNQTTGQPLSDERIRQLIAQAERRLRQDDIEAGIQRAFSSCQVMPLPDKLRVELFRLPWSTRVRHRIDRLGLDTLGDLVALTETAFTCAPRHRPLGPKTIQGLRDTLAALGVRFTPETL